MKISIGSKLITTALLLLAVSGCATMGTLTEPETKNKVFSGTVRHVELKCAHATCLDFPFSLVADVILLPVTIPWTAYRYIATDESVKTDKVKENEK
jgi:uncharacterized protein YceK